MQSYQDITDGDKIISILLEQSKSSKHFLVPRIDTDFGFGLESNYKETHYYCDLFPYGVNGFYMPEKKKKKKKKIDDKWEPHLLKFHTNHKVFERTVGYNNNGELIITPAFGKFPIAKKVQPELQQLQQQPIQQPIQQEQQQQQSIQQQPELQQQQQKEEEVEVASVDSGVTGEAEKKSVSGWWMLLRGLLWVLVVLGVMAGMYCTRGGVSSPKMLLLGSSMADGIASPISTTTINNSQVALVSGDLVYEEEPLLHDQPQMIAGVYIIYPEVTDPSSQLMVLDQGLSGSWFIQILRLCFNWFGLW
ncbi:putative mediator complex subunit 16 [Tieghemostelium lacteum]|uniref:Putative mediator complex subunit 16 n=1 Tax=Tieghemostelium lacteum TaxID=361077 RepID=A0A151ZCA4_TIELA|nr:putative mediator complex subunit 16 [Tieghemostelium lacteum]|eukprot:KYQ91571.1 putative mediator complex subunit 16 [Tieghemostelium lacteum]